MSKRKIPLVSKVRICEITPEYQFWHGQLSNNFHSEELDQRNETKKQAFLTKMKVNLTNSNSPLKGSRETLEKGKLQKLVFPYGGRVIATRYFKVATGPPFYRNNSSLNTNYIKTSPFVNYELLFGKL